MNPLIYVFSSIILVTCSQLLFKKGVKYPKGNNFMEKYLSWPIITGLFLNGIAAFCWILALSYLDLSYIFPFLSLNYILVPLSASVIYGEQLTSYRKLGIGIIFVGVIIIAIS